MISSWESDTSYSIFEKYNGFFSSLLVLNYRLFKATAVAYFLCNKNGNHFHCTRKRKRNCSCCCNFSRLYNDDTDRKKWKVRRKKGVDTDKKKKCTRYYFSIFDIIYCRSWITEWAILSLLASCWLLSFLDFFPYWELLKS